jgi:hypothetical protein
VPRGASNQNGFLTEVTNLKNRDDLLTFFIWHSNLKFLMAEKTIFKPTWILPFRSDRTSPPIPPVIHIRHWLVTLMRYFYEHGRET